MKKLPTPVVVLASLLIATALVFTLTNPIHAAEKSGGVTIVNPAGRAVPIKTIREFDNVFTTKLNEAMASREVKGNWILNKTVGPMFVTEKLIKYPDARAMTKAEITKLRDNISTQLRAAAGQGVSLNEVANGSIGPDFFVGNVAAPKRKKSSEVSPKSLTEPKRDLPGN